VGRDGKGGWDGTGCAGAEGVCRGGRPRACLRRRRGGGRRSLHMSERPQHCPRHHQTHCHHQTHVEAVLSKHANKSCMEATCHACMHGWQVCASTQVHPRSRKYAKVLVHASDPTPHVYIHVPYCTHSTHAHARTARTQGTTRYCTKWGWGYTYTVLPRLFGDGLQHGAKIQTIGGGQTRHEWWRRWRCNPIAHYYFMPCCPMPFG
jgi:hypothetical protein